jgi:NAD(P)-dependent dehydrogenase (short-subunit alcohol dehydrogenase family)
VSPVFRADLLSGLRVVVVGEAFASLKSLGADVLRMEPGGAVEAPVNALVCDARPSFAADGLQEALQFTWSAVRVVAADALIPAQDGGKIVLVLPAADAGPHAEAARAGLENLARTLSVEWARYGITVTAMAPGASTTEAELADLVCFVLSRAGDYFSGCRFDLGAV